MRAPRADRLAAGRADVPALAGLVALAALLAGPGSPAARAQPAAAAAPLQSTASPAQSAAPPAQTTVSSAPTTGDCAQRLAQQARRLEHPQLTLAWRAQPEPIAVGRPFAIEFEVCPTRAGAALDRVRVDASMPAHRHGMNYQPRVAQSAPGRYRADGLLWHMPGAWQVLFELQVDGEPVRLTQEITVR